MSSRLPLALGLDLSTQQLKIIAVSVKSLETVYERSLTFDIDFAHYRTSKGVYTNEVEHEVYSSIELWIEAVDLTLQKLKDDGFPFKDVVVVSGAAQQHAPVFWAECAKEMLDGLNPQVPLKDQLFPNAFAHPYSPNWQDHSTTEECDYIEDGVGGAENLANITGSKAHHRFTGPQILKFRKKYPERYADTTRVSLASSFLATLFLGKLAPIDISDVCGMNLWDIPNQEWSMKLLEIAGGDAMDLMHKLGQVERNGGAHLGNIHSYFTSRYGFSKNCIIIPFTGDNPATIASLPLSSMDSIISLGTSTTLLLTTKFYKPSPSYHIFNHPATKGLYFVMLCYKNGSLAREQIRNDIHGNETNDWEKFNAQLSSTKVLGGLKEKKFGFYFPLPEIIPDAPSGIWRFTIDMSGVPKKVDKSNSWTTSDDIRAIVESQALSMRLRAQPLSGGGKPRHLYFVGGASRNLAIVSVITQVIGSQEVAFRLTEDVTAGACAKGSAIKAAWAFDGGGTDFEEFVCMRLNIGGRLDKICVDDNRKLWDEYGSALDAYRQCETILLEGKSEDIDRSSN